MANTVRDFRNLKVWEKGHEMVRQTYSDTGGFPRDEIYGLTSQMRRSAVSIPANIAEGCGRRGRPELARFLTIAQGSAAEFEYYVILAHDLGCLTDSAADRLGSQVAEIGRMLSAYAARLQEDRS